jgi:hypothetical protein
MRYNRVSYVSFTHGGRLVNNYANSVARNYGAFEDAGVMPVGSIIAKDSFRPGGNGKRFQPGPLFIMEKMPAGFNADTMDWKYSMITPNGSVRGTTNGANASRVQFCVDCHIGVGEYQDSLFFMPDDYRK